jgi:acid phosphatase (class A)
MGGFGNPLVIGAACCLCIDPFLWLCDVEGMKWLLIFSAFLGVETASADWLKIASMNFSILDFPAEGSKAWQRDFEILFKEQKSRSQAQCRLSAKQPHPTYAAFFGHTELLDPDEYENTRELGERVASFTERVATYFKSKYERPRPYAEVKGLKPCVPLAKGEKAYPSSHAAVAVVTACMLADIYPQKKEDIEAYGLELGNLRYVVGLHHPSDVEAGQKLGLDICSQLRNEPSYRAEIKALQR